MSRNEDQYSPEVLEGQEAIAQTEDANTAEFSPSGEFSKSAMNDLVKVALKLQPMFGLEADYPTFDTDITDFPIEFVRLLLMFKQAVDDAIAEGILDDELAFSLDEVYDDTDVKLITNRLTSASRSKPFKKFLTKAAPKEEEEEVDELEVIPESAGPSDDDLFLQRL